jgi:hypothetical protein
MELRMDRMQRFRHRSLVRSLEQKHSLELHNLIRKEQPFQRRSLVRMLFQRHSLVHKLICTRACSSDRKVSTWEPKELVVEDRTSFLLRSLELNRTKRFQRHSLGRSLELRHNLIRMVQPFRLHSLDQLHNLIHMVQPFRLHRMDRKPMYRSKS